MNLSATTRAQAQQFLQQMRAVGSVPRVPLHPQSEAVVTVPMLREGRNVQRLWESWRAQRLPAGAHADLIYYVNNRQGASRATVRENAATADWLRQAIACNPHPQLAMHVVNRYHARAALPTHATMGYIRNASLSPAIAHALRMDRNVLLFSTDADTYPGEQSLAALMLHGGAEVYRYGCFAYDYELDSNLTAADRTYVTDTGLLDRTRGTIHRHIRSGDWPRSYDLAGCSTWYTVSSFLDVGGYRFDVEVEDHPMAHALRKQHPQSECIIRSAPLTNIIRCSDRCVGDGAHLAALMADDRRYMLAGAAMCAVLLENWVVHCHANEPDYARGRELLVREMSAHLGSAELVHAFAARIPQPVADGVDEEQYLAAYLATDAFLEAQTAPVPEAMRSYVPVIESLAGQHASFRSALTAQQQALGTHPRAHHLAFADYIRSLEPAVHSW